MNKILIYVKSILIPVIVGAVVGFITSSFIDYESLVRPPLAPPSWAFPTVWTILYVLMGVSYGLLKSNNQTNEEIDRIYYAQLVVNALWSFIYFVLKWRFFAFIWIVVLAILVIYMISLFYNKNKLAGLLQIPYLLWLLFAGYLNISTYLLNR